MLQLWIPSNRPFFDVAPCLRAGASKPKQYAFLRGAIRRWGWKEYDLCRRSDTFAQRARDQFAEVDFVNRDMDEHLPK